MTLQCPFTAADGCIIIKSVEQKPNKRTVVSFVEKEMPKPNEVFDIALEPCMGGFYIEYESANDLPDELYLRRYTRKTPTGIISHCFSYENNELVPTYSAFHDCDWHDMNMFNPVWSYSIDTDGVYEKKTVQGKRHSCHYSLFGTTETESHELENGNEVISFHNGSAKHITQTVQVKYLSESPDADTSIETIRSVDMDHKRYYEHKQISTNQDIIFVVVNQRRTGKMETKVYRKPQSKLETKVYRKPQSNFTSAMVDEHKFTCCQVDRELTQQLDEYFANPKRPEDYEIELMGLRLSAPVVLLDIPEEYRHIDDDYRLHPLDETINETYGMYIQQSLGKLRSPPYTLEYISSVDLSDKKLKFLGDLAYKPNPIKEMYEKLRNTIR